jgi:hypothetical protein
LEINRPNIAEEFSLIGIDKATKYYQKLIDATNSKKQKELTKEFLNSLIKKLNV